jgi:hypothetical protein
MKMPLELNVLISWLYKVYWFTAYHRHTMHVVLKMLCTFFIVHLHCVTLSSVHPKLCCRNVSRPFVCVVKLSIFILVYMEEGQLISQINFNCLMCNIHGANTCYKTKIICWYEWMVWVKQSDECSEIKNWTFLIVQTPWWWPSLIQLCMRDKYIYLYTNVYFDVWYRSTVCIH